MFCTLNKLHAWGQSKPAFVHFTVFVRLLLALGFLPAGLMKVADIPFGLGLGLGHPIGYFFDALHRARPWYTFMGWGQVIAAVLLLVPRAALLGALVYLAILANILLIVYSFDFGNTRLIVSFMLLGNLYLLAWDYPQLKRLLMRGPVGWPVGAGVAGPRCYAGRFAALAVVACGAMTAINLANLRTDLGWVGLVPAAGGGAGFGWYYGWYLQRLMAPPAQ